MYYPTVCVCFDVSDTDVVKILKFYDSIQKLTDITGAGTKCKRCLPRIYQMQKALHNVDKYSEFRKAFDEGKTIQHKINVWVDMKQPIFVDYKQYRIKPNQKDLHET